MLKVKVIHDCQKPSMKVGTKEVEYRSRRWFKWYTTKGIQDIYETSQAVWTCECGAVWDYMGAPDWQPTETGFWMNRSRPDTWKIVKE